MKKLFLIPILLFTSCVSQRENVQKATNAAAQISAIFTDHSNKWQAVFMAGKPSNELIAVVMAAAEEDRRRFSAVMNTFIQYISSTGIVDPIEYQKQALELAKSIKDLVKGDSK